uniref:PLAT domain-containing protein n=1 Tax=Zonotrichia albicollis TaxID=44394 RepID=A0A8D2N7I1_ZONAL
MPERASDDGSFLVTLYTGSRCNAGTKAEVFLQLIGQHGRSKFRCLWHRPSPAFQRGNIDCFLITTKKKLGDISSFKIRLNNDGKSSTWNREWGAKGAEEGPRDGRRGVGVETGT